MFAITHIFHEPGWIHLYGTHEEEVFEVTIGSGEPTFLFLNPTYQTKEELHTDISVWLRTQERCNEKEEEVLATYSRFCVSEEDEDLEERLEEVGVPEVLVTLLGGMLMGLSTHVN
jgi:hypothetical protein